MDVHRNKEEEQDIAAGIKNGDTRALIRWNNNYFKVFTHFTFQITQDREAAESIVSETFLKIWSLRLNFNTIHDIKAFTYTTCRNEAYNYVRDRESKRRKELLYGDLEELTGNPQPEQDAKKEEEQEAEAAYIRSVMYDRMLQQIDLLPPKRRQIIKLLLKGKDNAEVAKKLKISQAAVREAKMKAIQQIKKSLKDGKIILLSLLIIFK